MAASYPNAVKAFSTKTSGQTVASAHINDLQDEVVALETERVASQLGLSVDDTHFVDSPTQPRAVVFQNGAQTLANNTTTLITFDSETSDVGSMHSTVTNNSRLTVPAGGDGFYLVAALIYFESNATGVRIVYLNRNGSTVQATNEAGNSQANPSTVAMTWMGNLVAADYMELYAFQTSGGSLNIGSGSSRSVQNSFSIVKLW